MMFLATYDLGSKWLSDMMFATGSSYSVYLSPIMGYLTFSSFAGPIHAFFWMPLAFPLHFKEGADKTFYKRGLPGKSRLYGISVVQYEVLAIWILHLAFMYLNLIVFASRVY